MDNKKLVGIFTIRVIDTYGLRFTWIEHIGQWISSSWLISDTLRYMHLLQERGITCTHELRTWERGHYYHILINADQQTQIEQALEADHQAWLAEKVVYDEKYAASLAAASNEDFDAEF